MPMKSKPHCWKGSSMNKGFRGMEACSLSYIPATLVKLLGYLEGVLEHRGPIIAHL